MSLYTAQIFSCPRFGTIFVSSPNRLFIRLSKNCRPTIEVRQNLHTYKPSRTIIENTSSHSKRCPLQNGLQNFKMSVRMISSSGNLQTKSSPVLYSSSKENGISNDGKERNIEDKNDVPSEVNIGEGSWQEVYSGVLTTQLKLLKMFSIGTSVIGLSVQPILYEKLGSADLAFVMTLASMLGFFTFVTPAMIHWVSKKYVTKLEYDPERDIYAATTLSFFLREKKIHFKIDDVSRPDIPGMFTSFLVKNKPLFVDPGMFENLDHYSRIMGFDKPIDFRPDHERKQS